MYKFVRLFVYYRTIYDFYIMNLKEQYDKLWRLIIRPKRTTYPQSKLGPQKFKLDKQNIIRHDFQITNDRGYVMFCSHFIPQNLKQYPCMIYAHGNSSNRTEGMEYLSDLLRQGISLCTFDFSGCGNSQGDYISLGYFEKYDLDYVVKYIRKKPEVISIGLWGRSMGAVAVLLYMKTSQNVSVIILDSPFKSLQSLVEHLCQQNSNVPLFLLSGALRVIDYSIKTRAKFSIYDINPLKDAVKYLKFPAFFIVGLGDQLIPPQHTKQLFDTYKGKTKEIRVVKGDHNSCRPYQCIKEAILFFKQNYSQTTMENTYDNDSDYTNLSQTLQEDMQCFQAQIQNLHIDFFDEKAIKQHNKTHHKQQEYKEKQWTFFNNSLQNQLNFDQIDDIFQPEQSVRIQKQKQRKQQYYQKIKKELSKVDQTQFYYDIINNLQQWSFVPSSC